MTIIRGVQAILCIAVIAMTIPSVSTAQTGVAQKDEPTTKFERVLLTKGTMLVREYYGLGALAGRHGGMTQFEVARVYVPGSAAQATMALRVTVKESGRLERERIGVLDREEVVSFAKAIPEMMKMVEVLKGLQKLDADDGSTEVAFSGGSLKFTLFVGRRKGDGVAIDAGGIGSTTVFLDVSDMKVVERAVSRAISKMNDLDQKR